MSSDFSAAGSVEPVHAVSSLRTARSGHLADGAYDVERTDVSAWPTPRERQIASRWERRYAAAVIVSDVASIVASIAASVVSGYSMSFLSPAVVAIVALVTVIGMCSALLVVHAWQPRVLGQGSEEFNRLIRAVISSSVILGLVGLAVSAPGVRPWVFGVIPIAGVLAVLGRYGLRQILHRLRRGGRCVHHVLAVGDEEAVTDLIDRTRRDVHQGMVVAGACTPRGTGPDGLAEIRGVAVVNDLDDIAATVLRCGYRAVAVAPSAGWGPQRLRQLAWDLEGTGVELVVQPGLMEIAGPRLHVTPVDGLPLLRLTEPVFTGIPLLVKGAVDRLGALLLLLAMAPVLLMIAVAVRLEGGPVFFRQVRVGRNGRPFRMLKFRSMVVDAERFRVELLSINEAAGPLFKLKRDPRITRIGRLLRAYSLDELPQLVNVLSGSMSLVGPRPPMPDEVATYSRDAMRKLLVKPGLTGLWQISGRSDLSWEESVRLDVRYVENWNLALDALILWKTIGAVIGRDGAY